MSFSFPLFLILMCLYILNGILVDNIQMGLVFSSTDFTLLIGILKQITFDMIIDIIGFISTMLGLSWLSRG